MRGALQVVAHAARDAHRGQAGQMTIEWALVMAGVALPMYFVIRTCVDLLVAHFQMVTFMQTLPFP